MGIVFMIFIAIVASYSPATAGLIALALTIKIIIDFRAYEKEKARLANRSDWGELVEKIFDQNQGG